jgi:serine O-acetyltransferase
VAKGDSTSRQVELQEPSTLRELVRVWIEDWKAHERDSTRPGFRALAVYRFGNYRMHFPRYQRAGMSMCYRMLFRYVRNHYSIELPYSAKVGRRVVIEHQGAIVIHGNSVIGDECVLRQGVTLGNRHLQAPFDAPVLGRAVNVGAGAKILGAVRIGDGASIGANSVVLRDVPAGATAVGIPARLLGESKS